MLITFETSGFNTKLLLTQEGVSVKDGAISFDPAKGWTEKRAKAYLQSEGKKTIHREEYRSKKLEPTPEDVQLIGEITDISIDELEVRELLLMNSSIIDRVEDLATDRALQVLADAINSEKTRLNIGHDRSGPTVARSFKAYIKNVQGVNWLAVKFYIDKTLPMPGFPGYTVARGIAAKMLDHVSIGFFGPPGKYDEDQKAWILDFTSEDNVLVFEISFVDLGAVQGARVKQIKQAPTPEVKPKFIPKMATKSFQVGKETYTVTATNVDGKDPEVDTLALEGQIKSLHDQKETAEAKAKTAQDELKEAKKSFVENIQAKQSHESMGMPENLRDSEDDLYGKSLTKLKALSEHLDMKYVELNPTGQVDNSGNTNSITKQTEARPYGGI